MPGLLDSITGYVGSPQGGNMLQALGMSLMSSPRNAPLANFGEFYGGLQKQQMQADERDQQRGAIAAALKSWGVPDSEAAILSANPSAAEIRINQLKAEKEKAERNQFLSGLGGLGGLGGTRPVADDVSSPPAVSDATAPQSAPSPAPVARQSLLGLPGAAQADYNHFRTDAAPPSDQYLEPVENIPQVPAQSQPPASGKPTADNLGLPASARQGAIMSGSDGKSYQYVQKSGGTDGVGEWGWTEVNLGGSQPKSGNKTMDYLQKNHPEVAALVNDQTGITPRDGLEIAQIQKQGQKRAADTQAKLDQLYTQRDSIARRLANAPDQESLNRAKIAYLDPIDSQIARLEKQKGSDFDQRASAASMYGLDPNSEEGRNFILTGKLPEQRGGAAELGLNPQYGVDDNGNPVLLQLGKDGKVVRSALPEGVHLSKEPIKVDLGTSWGLIDPITRQVIGNIPKDLAGASAEQAKGKAQGALQASLPSDIMNTQQAISDIDDLIANPGLDSIVGGMDQYRPSWLLGDSGRDAAARLNQIKGKTFLQAYATLKGGGAITEVEGKKAEDAIGRLDRAQDEKTFRNALTDLRDVIAQGQQVMLQKAGIPKDQWGSYLTGGAGGEAGGGVSKTSTGLQWSIEGQ